MGEVRRRYSEQFKREAVELSYSSGETIRQTAENLGISKPCWPAGVQNVHRAKIWPSPATASRSSVLWKKKTGV